MISNSFKYKDPEKEEPFISVELLELQSDIVIWVRDNGEGIPEGSLDKVFTMFYRASSTSIGTGLGLYICKEIVDKLNGSMSIESEFGKGTSVKLVLPKNKCHG